MFNAKNLVTGLIILSLMTTIAYFGYFDMVDKYNSQKVSQQLEALEKTDKEKKELEKSRKKLDADWKELRRAFSKQDFVKARLLLNNFFVIDPQYKNIERIEKKLLKIEELQKERKEKIPPYKILTFNKGTVYGWTKDRKPLKRKDVWIIVSDKLPSSKIEWLGSRVLMQEKEKYQWVNIYVQRNSNKRGMSVAIFELKEGLYTYKLMPEVINESQ
ncbi:MAG: hypothetical protein HQK84_07275 [Nitrospinae bacterium]|nr:hypothetical protein [Nitrospinota bacterium]